MNDFLSNDQLKRLDAYWRASNYLAVGQIYLKDNPLLRKPLQPNHIKPRLLGHWGTTPGLNLIYVHLNLLITAHDLDMILITGPGHGGPASGSDPGDDPLERLIGLVPDEAGPDDVAEEHDHYLYGAPKERT